MTYPYDDNGNPEIAADLDLRDATEHDGDRRRSPAPLLGGSSATAAEWPCKAKCGALVGITEATVEIFRMFNSQLRKRGESPIDIAGTVYCQKCRAYLESRVPDEARKYQDRMREVIGELKDAVAMGDGAKEREAMKRLQGKHPDATGLLESLRNHRKAKRGGMRGDA